MRHFTDYVGRRNSHELLSARGDGVMASFPPTLNQKRFIYT